MKNLREKIFSYPDFPEKGILFQDILGITQDPDLFKEIIIKMSSSSIIKNADVIISIDARGFIFGTAIAMQSSKPMIVARKPNKLPGKLLKRNYSLEYGENSLSIQKNVALKYERFAIVDDILATGGTANCCIELIKSIEKKVNGLCVIAEIEDLKGRTNLKCPVDSQIKL